VWGGTLNVRDPGRALTSCADTNTVRPVDGKRPSPRTRKPWRSWKTSRPSSDSSARSAEVSLTGVARETRCDARRVWEARSGSPQHGAATRQRADQLLRAPSCAAGNAHGHGDPAPAEAGGREPRSYALPRRPRAVGPASATRQARAGARGTCFDLNERRWRCEVTAATHPPSLGPACGAHAARAGT
jgi:hypothetical protein